MHLACCPCKVKGCSAGQVPVQQVSSLYCSPFTCLHANLLLWPAAAFYQLSQLIGCQAVHVV